jgi:hypothetical protein
LLSESFACSPRPTESNDCVQSLRAKQASRPSESLEHSRTHRGIPQWLRRSLSRFWPCRRSCASSCTSGFLCRPDDPDSTWTMATIVISSSSSAVLPSQFSRAAVRSIQKQRLSWILSFLRLQQSRQESSYTLTQSRTSLMIPTALRYILKYGSR